MIQEICIDLLTKHRSKLGGTAVFNLIYLIRTEPERFSITQTSDNLLLAQMAPNRDMNTVYYITISHEVIACTCGRAKQVCSHLLAAAFFLHETESNRKLKSDAEAWLKQRKVEDNIMPIKQKPIPMAMALGFTDFQIFNKMDAYQVSSFHTGHAETKIAYQYEKKKYKVRINYVNGGNVELDCTCENKVQGFCEHGIIGYSVLLNKHPEFLKKYAHFDSERNKLLENYGLNIEDPESDLFTFIYGHFGQWRISEIKDSFIPKLDTEAVNKLYQSLELSGNERETSSINQTSRNGVLFSFSKYGFSYLQAIEIKSQTPLKLKKLNARNENSYINGITKLSHYEMEQYCSRLTYYRYNGLNAEHLRTANDYFSINFKHLLENNSNSLNYYIEGDKTNPNLIKVDFSFDKLILMLEAKDTGKFISLSLKLKDENGNFATHYGGIFWLIGQTIYLANMPVLVPLMEMFKGAKTRLAKSEWDQFYIKIIKPLESKIEVKINFDLGFNKIETLPEVSLRVSELDKYLLLIPEFKYDNIKLNYAASKSELVKGKNGKYNEVVRSRETEDEFIEKIEPMLLPESNKLIDYYYSIPFAEALKKSWFFNFIKSLNEQKIKVTNLENLNKCKINPNLPQKKVKVTTVNDWFDVHIDITYGQQIVELQTLLKAIKKGEEYVVLPDGSLGLIPENWKREFALLGKVGEKDSDGNYRVQKINFTLIDLLISEIDDAQILAEINEKKLLLAEIENTETVNISKKIKATLRPYQLAGLHWLQVLEQVGWGGCLADDMGLGKTLQTISFLQYLKEKHGKTISLVVCPTSLLYNWEREFEKFCPSMKIHVYYGANRDETEIDLKETDVLITSYGMMRNDIEYFKEIEFNYVILDESQSIKNMDAQVSKAARLLRAKNRLILSGTPIQNNTMDLYSQFHFLNPGMLGSRDYFMEEFANPIDKKSDRDTTQLLQKIIYPFMMRRTKQKVALDLPDKTESIMWCEMGKEQRKFYNNKREFYRKKLLEKIEAEGLAKSGLMVLEGLLRLRQICDSPLLLNEEFDTKLGASSVKIEELLREVQENISDHKALVFSQFTEMLALIRQELDILGIKYYYLDGSTKASDRAALMQKFNDTNEAQLFLISLKAGGVGLNLTAADYVYLVDPWWNPAVEQQAIDRTHRIGQTQKVFAYKLICKNSIEEKILKLQEKKKGLSDELISEDAGFIKKLTKDDINYLFSE